jgi:hypothetical protein
MEELKQAINEAHAFIKAHADKKEEVLGYLDLLESEILEGGSPSHELESFRTSLTDLLIEDED